jgi:osmotically-inducible protein OsmY
MKGMVQLSGFAKSWAERDRAEALARSVKGVTGVRNDIIVRVPT